MALAHKGLAFETRAGARQRQGRDRLQRPGQGADPERRRSCRLRFLEDRRISGKRLSGSAFAVRRRGGSRAVALRQRPHRPAADRKDRAGADARCAGSSSTSEDAAHLRKLERLFKKSLEEMAAQREQSVTDFRRALDPVRVTLRSQPFLCGHSAGLCRLYRVLGFPMGAHRQLNRVAGGGRCDGRLARTHARSVRRVRAPRTGTPRRSGDGARDGFLRLTGATRRCMTG